jgi:carbamate kinase
MGPKVASACSFVRAGGTMAGVGRLTDARAIVEGRAGTRISNTSAPNLPR